MNHELREMLPEDGAQVSINFEEGIVGGNATFDKEVPTWEYWDKTILVPQICLQSRMIIITW